MTHDELLAQLEGLWHDSFKAPGYQALRAVVELHKPSLVNAEECETCTLHTDYSDRYIAYPCETIQAIEEQIK